MKGSRALILIAILIVAAAGSWYYFSHRGPSAAEHLTVYYTKADGTSLGTWIVSLRPPAPGEGAAEHQHNAALYAAVQAVAGPPSDVQAVRFPTGTHVLGVSVSGSTATVDLSNDVAHESGTFAENGEFKGLVYTVTGITGIDAVQITIGGQKMDTLPGGHLELDQPLHRSDW